MGVREYNERERKWGKEFRAWQQKFYRSKDWIKLRNHVRNTNGMRCNKCGKLIKGKSIVDHIEEVTPDNKNDTSITLNESNLQLLCLACHNSKTFAHQIDYELKNRNDVNLF